MGVELERCCREIEPRFHRVCIPQQENNSERKQGQRMKPLTCFDMNFGGARPAPNEVAYKCESGECARMMLGGTDKPDAKCRMQTACKEEG